MEKISEYQVCYKALITDYITLKLSKILNNKKTNYNKMYRLFEQVFDQGKYTNGKRVICM